MDDSRTPKKARLWVDPFQNNEEEEDSSRDRQDGAGPSKEGASLDSRPAAIKPKAKKKKVSDNFEEEDSDSQEEEAGKQDDPSVAAAQEEDLDNDLEKYKTEDPEKMRLILAKFSAPQMQRYECYKRSAFQKSNMKKLLSSLVGYQVTPGLTVAFSGIAKLFVGDLIESARLVMKERQDIGPLRPSHVREALRRMKEVGKMPAKGKPPLFRC